MTIDYNPDIAPDPEDWLNTDEGERILVIEDYHRQQGLHCGSDRMHAATHAIVENQVALGDDYIAAAKLAELMKEGLSRHDAIHAIGSVLLEHMRWLYKSQAKADEANKRYAERLKALTAVSWYEDAGVPAPREPRAKPRLRHPRSRGRGRR